MLKIRKWIVFFFMCFRFKTPEQTEAFIAKFREAVSGASIVSKTPEKAAEPSKASEPAGMTTDSVTLKWRFEGFLGHLAFSILFFACDMLTLRWLSKAFWLLSKVKNVTSLRPCRQHPAFVSVCRLLYFVPLQLLEFWVQNCFQIFLLGESLVYPLEFLKSKMYSQ